MSSYEKEDDDNDACPELISVQNEDAAHRLLLPFRKQENDEGQQQTEPDHEQQTHVADEDDILHNNNSNNHINNNNNNNQPPPVPLVILSGFLGSGKTTLIQYVLSANHGMKIAVIVNEFEFGRSIEKGLTVRSAEATSDEWMELKNGCMCCSAKSQSVQALEQLVTRRKGNLDAILIETAGLADPVPIARSFWLDDALQAKVQLAGIVVVVDSSNIENYITSEKLRFVEAARQLLAADRIVMNKIDVCGVDCRGDGDRTHSLSFMDDQEKVHDFLFSTSSSSSSSSCSASCPEKLQRAACAVKEVNPVAPITLTCLTKLLSSSLSSSSDGPTVPVETLKKLLLLAPQSTHSQSSTNNNNRWHQYQSQHQHTTDITSSQIEVSGRVFESVRDVDFFYAAILDNSVDGQDELDEQVPAQLKAEQRGSVIVRSKSAVWVKNPEYFSAKLSNDEETNKYGNDCEDSCGSSSVSSPSALLPMKYLAFQVQSIGATFEVVPMLGLNKKLLAANEKSFGAKATKGERESAREDSCATCVVAVDDEDDDNDSILQVGVTRMLFLGLGLRDEEILNTFKEKTVEM